MKCNTHVKKMLRRYGKKYDYGLVNKTLFVKECINSATWCR